MSNISDTSIGLVPLSHIKSTLDRIFKKGIWKGWELETISDELGVAFDELTRDKIHLLQVMEQKPELFSTDMTFFLHAVDVLNNKVADFDYLPMPNCLELAYAITEAKKILGTAFVTPAPGSDLTDTVAYLLIEEGFSHPLAPFEFVPAERLTAGQTKEDTAAKEKAIAEYIKHMDAL